MEASAGYEFDALLLRAVPLCVAHLPNRLMTTDCYESDTLKNMEWFLPLLMLPSKLSGP